MNHPLDYSKLDVTGRPERCVIHGNFENCHEADAAPTYRIWRIEPDGSAFPGPSRFDDLAEANLVAIGMRVAAEVGKWPFRYEVRKEQR